MPLMKLTVLVDAPAPSFSVEMENVSHGPLFVTTMMTVETEAMSNLAHMQLVKGISSPVQAVAAFTRAGFVMEMMTVKIMRTN